MADIHDEANEVVEKTEQTEQELFDEMLVEDCLTDVQWLVTTCQHYVSRHELTDHEVVQLLKVAHEATLQKIHLLDLD